MCTRAHFIGVVCAAMACALLGLATAASAQIFWRLPAGWNEDIEETYWVAFSKRDAAGYVSLIRPAAMTVSGPREAAFARLADQWAGTLGGTVVERGPAVEFMPRYSTLTRVFRIRDERGRILSLQVVAHFCFNGRRRRCFGLHRRR